MKTKLLLLAFLAQLFVLKALAFDWDAQVNGIYYKFKTTESGAKYASVMYEYYPLTSDSYSNSDAYTGSVTIPSQVTYKSVTYPVTEINGYAFMNCSGLTSVSIPSSVNKIGQGAFENCSSLVSVNIPSTVTYLSRELFKGCISLTNIYIPSSINNIEDGVFYGCTNLSSISIPASVKSLGSQVFWGCTRLKTISIPSSVVKIGDAAFEGTQWFDEWYAVQNNGPCYINDIFFKYKGTVPNHIDINEGCVSVAGGALKKCTTLKSIHLPQSLEVIEDYAFQGCTKLESIELLGSFKRIEEYAFQDCSGLISVTFPESLEYIGRQAFENCSSLEKVDIPINARIYNFAFQNCTGLTTVSTPFGNGHWSAPYTFVGCTSLMSAVILEGTTYVYAYAFKDCPNLTNLSLPSTIERIDVNALANCNNIVDVTIYRRTPVEIDSELFPSRYVATLHVPEGCKQAYQATANWRDFKNIVEMVSVKEIQLSQTSLSLQSDESEKVLATVLPENASNKVLKWSSSDPEVASIENGRVTAHADGTAIITASATDGSGVRATCKVTVGQGTDISQLDNIIYLGTAKAGLGSAATLSFNMKNTAAIRGFQFDLYLPEGITAVKNAKGRIQASLSSGRLPEDDEHTLTVTEQTDGAIRFLCGSQYDETFTGNEGELLTLQVNIDETIPDGDYPVILKEMRLSETDINKYYDTKRIVSILTLPLYILGDINGDGVVNVSDYIGIANHILGNTPEGFIEKAGDVNEDNVINVSDYIGVANFILTGSFNGASNVKAAHMPAKATNLNAQENVIYVEPMEADPGTQVTLSLQMKNSAAIRGFQFDLYLPEGVTAVKNAKGRIQGSLSSGRLPEDDEHTLTIQAQNDGAIRFLCGSQYDETFTGASGEIATLQVNVAEGMTSGEYPIVLKNMRLSETDISKYYDTDNVETVLTVRGEEPTPEWHDGDVFTAQTVEGVDMIFQVISAKDKTCGVGKEDDFDASIDPDYNGKVTIPSMIKGLYVTKIHFCAFSYCDITSVSIPEGITDINAYAFADCNSLSSIQLPESLERIEREALRGTAITSLTIPANVSFIEDTYEGMSENLVGLTENLESIVVDSRNNYYDSRNNCNAIIETATNRLISGCQNTMIPEDVESIEGYAFWGCSYLTSISIPKKVKSIGDLAFSWCTSLKSVILSEGLESIGTYAFSHSDIKEITIPSTVTSLGSGIVSNCANLETITSCIVRPTDIDDKVFGADLGHEPVYDKVILYVPDGSISFYKKAEGWKNFYDIRTGIKAIYSNGQDHNTIYTLSGHEIQVPQRGVNIIRSGDGTTRKVLVK